MAAVLSAILILVRPACASRNEAPDPVKVQEEIAEYRSQELELVRSTVTDHERADRLIRLLGERDRLISDSVKEIDEDRKQISELNADTMRIVKASMFSSPNTTANARRRKKK